MNIGSTAASSSLTSLLNSNASSISNAGAADGSASGAIGGRHRHHHGSGGAQSLFDALQTTLQQLGLSPAQRNGAAAGGNAGASNSSDGSNATGAVSGASATSSTSATSTTNNISNISNISSSSAPSQGVGSALRAFMHALFQAAQADGGNNGLSQTTAPTATHSHAYGDMSSKLQNLLQSLAAGNTPSTAAASDAGSGGSSADANLNTAFQNLLQTLGSSTAADSDSATVPVSLQSFAQELLQNLQAGASNPFENAGSLVSTTV